MLRWHLQRAVGHPQVDQAHRLAENIDIFDFELSTDELKAIDALDTAKVAGPEYTDEFLLSFGVAIPEA